MQEFVTRCRVPKRSATGWQALERLVREDFASECQREVIPRLPRRPEIVRIRRLAVQLTFTGEFDRKRVARAWAQAFAAELFAAMATPNSNGANLVRSETRAEWLARFIFDLISGAANSRWEYAEFAELFRLSTVEAALTVLRDEPDEIVPVLLLLEAQNGLDQLLLLFGDLAFEQLFVSIASVPGKPHQELTIDDLLTIGALATSHSCVSGILATRRRALRLFLALARRNQDPGRSSWTPRLVFHALMTLDVLAEVTQSLEPAMWADHLTPESLTRSGCSLNSTVLALVEQVRRKASKEGRDDIQDGKLALVAQLIDDLTPLASAKNAERGKASYWLSSDYAGLLLLVGLLDQFEWPQRILKTSLGLTYGSRAIIYCFAGLGLRILGHSLEPDRLDSGVCVFAGWTQPSSADLGSFGAFISSVSKEQRLEFLRALGVGEENEGETCSDWSKTLDRLAGYLAREFALRIRGFRKAAGSFIVKTFFRQPGRICIEDKRILVILQRNPFHIALHISNLDEAVERVSWLGDRRLEFELEDL